MREEKISNMRQMVNNFGVFNTPTKGEVIVEFVSAVPVVTEVKKSYKVDMKPEHLEFGLTGYVFAESELGKVFKKAAEDGIVILARFEKSRKKDIDINIPITELTKDLKTARDSISKSFTGIYNENEHKWVMQSGAFQPSMDTPEMQECVENVLVNNHPRIDVDSFFDEPKAPTIKPDTFDKSQVLATLYYTLIDYENKSDFELTEEQRRAVTVKLLKLCDEIQKVILESDQVDYRDYSHVRARFLVFSYAEKVEPITQETLQDINGWLTRCLTKSKYIVEWTKTV